MMYANVFEWEGEGVSYVVAGSASLTEALADHGYRARAPNEPLRPMSHPNIITNSTYLFQRVITPPPWTQFWLRLKQSIRVNLENNSRTNKLRKNLV
jgi:hypothetical protein